MLSFVIALLVTSSLATIDPVGTTTLTQPQIDELLNAANFIRSSVRIGSVPYQDTYFPKGAITDLTWSPTLQQTSQDAANLCTIVSPDPALTRGYTINPIYNLAALDLTTLFRRTFQESRNFLQIAHIDSFNLVKIGIANLLAQQTYTNDWAASLMYSQTTQIGCGVNQCLDTVTTQNYYYLNCQTDQVVPSNAQLYTALKINSATDITPTTTKSYYPYVLQYMNDIRQSFNSAYTGTGKIYQLGDFWPIATIDIPSLTWDTTMANIAQASIDSCIGKFQTDSYGFAEYKTNVAQVTEQTVIVNQWVEQGKYAYNVDKNNKNVYDPVAMFKGKEFTQMIWSGTTTVGCGQTTSSTTCTSYDIDSSPYYIMRCLFWPIGNIAGQPIYQ